MKTLLFVLLISNIIVFAQDNTTKKKEKFNPDGERVSIHITPFWCFENQTVTNMEELNYSRKSNICINIRIKIPARVWTISPFFEVIPNEFDEYIAKERYRYKITNYRFGTTISLYL